MFTVPGVIRVFVRVVGNIRVVVSVVGVIGVVICVIESFLPFANTLSEPGRKDKS